MPSTVFDEPSVSIVEEMTRRGFHINMCPVEWWFCWGCCFGEKTHNTHPQDSNDAPQEQKPLPDAARQRQV